MLNVSKVPGTSNLQKVGPSGFWCREHRRFVAEQDKALPVRSRGPEVICVECFMKEVEEVWSNVTWEIIDE